jgi:archaellum biogenesis ATPase FlaH
MGTPKQPTTFPDENEISLEKQLGEVTNQKTRYESELVSSGIRELDEMMGGGFRPGMCNLIQEDLGAGGLVVIEKIIEIQLSLDNKVLVILTDPTAEFFVNRLKELNTSGGDLVILDFVKKSRNNIEILFDKHELSLQIQEAQQELMDRVKEANDEDVYGFVVYLTLNPFLMNLDEKTVTRMLFESVLLTSKLNMINITLVQKNIINTEYHARMLSMFHAVIDLSSEYRGIQKMNYIRILKYIGRYFDPKIEPYMIEFDTERNKYNFLIRSAFLTSFDTFRSLLEWQGGTIYLSKVPYVVTPVAYISLLMEIPLLMDKERGRKELIEKGMTIGRILTINTDSLYHLSGVDLLKATIRGAALQGYGYIRVVDLQMDENFLSVRHLVHPAFILEPYLAFLEGFYRGVIRRTLKREIRSITFTKQDFDDVNQTQSTEPIYNIKIRLDPTETKENVDLSDDF